MDQRKRHGQLQAYLRRNRADRRVSHRPFLSYIQKGINELWVSGRQNLDERADGYVSEAGKFRFSGEQQIFIYG